VKWNPSELRASPMMDRPVRRWERNSMMYSFSCFTTAALWTVSTGDGVVSVASDNVRLHDDLAASRSKTAL